MPENKLLKPCSCTGDCRGRVGLNKTYRCAIDGLPGLAEPFTESYRPAQIEPASDEGEACPIQCGHSVAEHEAFDAGLRNEIYVTGDPHLGEIYLVGQSVWRLNHPVVLVDAGGHGTKTRDCQNCETLYIENAALTAQAAGYREALLELRGAAGAFADYRSIGNGAKLNIARDKADAALSMEGK